MKKRLMLSLMTVALVALLASGATFALFTAQTSNNSNTFTAGTVRLGDVTTTTASVGPVAPGDEGVVDFTVTYNGNLDAFLGVAAAVVDNSGDQDANNDLPIQVTGVNDAAGNALTEVNGYYVLGEYSNGATVNFEVPWTLDSSTGDEYQGDTAQLEVTVTAVQSKNNGAGTSAPTSW